MVRLPEHGDCFQAPRSPGAIRDQTAGKIALVLCIPAATGITVRCMRLPT